MVVDCLNNNLVLGELLQSPDQEAESCFVPLVPIKIKELEWCFVPERIINC